MYGLLLEGVCCSLKELFGEEVSDEIKRKANVHNAVFGTHQCYSETVFPRLAKAAHEVTGKSYDDIMESFGAMFVTFVAKYGHDRLLKVLGRNIRDFMNNLDNLHAYLRFSYPRMSAPSFFVTDESAAGLTLHYRSKRKGYIKYVQGQVRQVAKVLYGADVNVDILQMDEARDATVVEMRVMFDNSAYAPTADSPDATTLDFSVTSSEFLTLFPFHIVFDELLSVTSIGKSLGTIMPQLLGAQLDDVFTLRRPLSELSYQSIVMHTNNIFELESMEAVSANADDDHFIDDDSVSCVSFPNSGLGRGSPPAESAERRGRLQRLALKGEMVVMNDWKSIMFLGTPVLADLHQMFRLGIYVNDLSIHDSSRDLILIGSQQSAELALLLDQEQSKTRSLEESMTRLDEEIQRTDRLLYQMMPKPVADRLRRGEPTVNTCEAFDSCTIMLCDVVGFTAVCSKIGPMQVVSMLNDMYTCFDVLIEKNRCYKVETIGDAYMAVGGVPIRSTTHAADVTDMAAAILTAAQGLADPSDPARQTHLRLRVGIHSGAVVAGVVGRKMPRYCLFGETVSIAQRLESTGAAMKIHLSESTRAGLPADPKYETEESGSVEVKEKCWMKTYWLKTEFD